MALRTDNAKRIKFSQEGKVMWGILIFESGSDILWILKRTLWAGHVAYMGDMRNPTKSLVSKTKWKRLLVRPRHTWKNITKVSYDIVSCMVPMRKVSWMLLQEGRSLSFRLRQGVGLAAHTRNNSHIKCIGVYCA